MIWAKTRLLLTKNVVIGKIVVDLFVNQVLEYL